MKTIKIFALPSHLTKERLGGVDFVRVVQPMKHLDGFKMGKYQFKVDIYDIFRQEDFDWKTVATNYDLVFFNYTVLDWNYAAMGTFVHGMGKKMIMDLDDALWYVNPDNISYESLKKAKVGEVISAILRDVDGVVTTNTYLKHLITHEAHIPYDYIVSIPNAVDLEYYNHKSPAKDSHIITLFHYGSTTHFSDLTNQDFIKGVDRIFKEYPNVILKSVGAAVSELKNKWGERYDFGFGHVDIYHWIKDKFPGYMDEADIMVVPLQDNIYNRCKSDIKFLETATATKPGVYSDLRQYHESIEHGITGFLADSPEDWYESLKILIESVKKRKEIGENAYNYVKKFRQIDKYVPAYAEFILKVLGI